MLISLIMCILHIVFSGSLNKEHEMGVTCGMHRAQEKNI
jgi:hypothetical protein